MVDEVLVDEVGLTDEVPEALARVVMAVEGTRAVGNGAARAPDKGAPCCFPRIFFRPCPVG